MPPSEQPDFEREKIERLRRAMYSREMSDKLKERPRRAMDEITPLVGEDWHKEEEKLEGSKIAPRFIGATRALLTWILVVSIVFFIGAVSFFAYYFAFGGGSVPAAAQNIDISVSGPPSISGGSPAELQISVVNRNNVSLQLAELVITYPKGTRSPTDFATDLPSQRIPLNTIESGGRRQGTVSAVFAGSEGQNVQVKVDLEYRVAGSSAIFVASGAYSVAFSSSPISVSIDGNTQTVSGQPVQLTVNVAANSSAPIRDVLLSIEYPFGFKLVNADPKATNERTWSLGDFAPGERKSVVLQGALTGESGDTRVFRFTAGTRKSTAVSGIDTKLSENTFAMQISQPFLGLTVSANKQLGPAVIAPGDNVSVAVTYQNNLSTELTDAVIVARLSGVQVDGTTVHSTDGFYRSSDNAVLWDKSTTGGALASLAPGAKGVVSFSFQVPKSGALRNATNPHIDISVNASGKRLSETGVPQNLQSTARQTLKFATDLTLIAQALYYSNPFGSVGPMPPKANTETTYAAVFIILNTTNKITNAVLTARMPVYVRWGGIYSPAAEKVTFNHSDSTVTWDIGTIEPGVGLNDVKPKQMLISLGFTPSSSQIGQSPVLLSSITLTGIDAATGAAITRKATPDITTNLAQISKSSPETVSASDSGFSPANATVVK